MCVIYIITLISNNLLSLSYGRIIKKDIETSDGLLPESFETYQIVHPGDIIFRLTDLQNDKRSLRTAIATELGIITFAYAAFEPRVITPAYLNYLLRDYDLRKIFYSMGGGVRQSMKFDDIKRLPTLVPPKNEQSTIVQLLDYETAKIDSLIEEQQRLIELLREKRHAVISHAVTKGLDPNARIKASDTEWLGNVPEHWTMNRVRYLFKQEKRQSYPQKPVLSVYREYGVILKDSREDNINQTPDDLSAYQLVNPDDLVVNKIKAWQGSLGVSTLEGITSPDYVVFAPHHKECSAFLHLLFRSQRMVSVYRSISNGIRPAQWRLEPDTFLGLPVFLPPKAEQQAIASFIYDQTRRFEKLSVEAERTIAILQERRGALISAAVTGKINLLNHTRKVTG